MTNFRPSFPRRRIMAIGFDADDTLWPHAAYYNLAEDRILTLLAEFGDVSAARAKLRAVEERNLRAYGFGVKGFTLSMIETAIEIAGKSSNHYIISEIIDAGRELLSHPIQLLPQVRETLEYLSANYQTILITRGDLFDQERKLANSGLADAFDSIEIVSDKDVKTYTRIFGRYEGGPGCAAMVGNSLRSDILPAIEAGSWGLYIPHHISWSVEHAEPPAVRTRFRQLRQFADLPAALGEIEQIDTSESDLA